MFEQALQWWQEDRTQKISGSLKHRPHSQCVSERRREGGGSLVLLTQQELYKLRPVLIFSLARL